jgi:hypothetical protein
MEEDFIGSQGPRWTVTLEVEKKKEKKIKIEILEITCTGKRDISKQDGAVRYWKVQKQTKDRIRFQGCSLGPMVNKVEVRLF